MEDRIMSLEKQLHHKQRIIEIIGTAKHNLRDDITPRQSCHLWRRRKCSEKFIFFEKEKNSLQQTSQKNIIMIPRRIEIGVLLLLLKIS